MFLRSFILLFSLLTASYSHSATNLALDDDRQGAQRAYPGGQDEEELRVQEQLPEAARKIDHRAIESQVFKTLYKEDPDPVEQESAED